MERFLYDVQVFVAGRPVQTFEVRDSKLLTKRDIRLADLNFDGYLDIMLAMGTDEQGRESFKSLIYDKKKQEYRWLGE